MNTYNEFLHELINCVWGGIYFLVLSIKQHNIWKNMLLPTQVSCTSVNSFFYFYMCASFVYFLPIQKEYKKMLVSTNTYIGVYIYIYIYSYVYMSVDTYTLIYVNACVCVNINMYINVCICEWVYMHIYMCVCVYIYIYIYIYEGEEVVYIRRPALLEGSSLDTEDNQRPSLMIVLFKGDLKVWLQADSISKEINGFPCRTQIIALVIGCHSQSFWQRVQQ